MSDNDKQNPDDFEDEFDFDEAFDETDVEELDVEALDEDAEKITEETTKSAPSPMRPPSKSPIPLIVAVLAIGFLSWKGYQWIAKPKEGSELDEVKANVEAPSIETALTTDKMPEPEPKLQVNLPAEDTAEITLTQGEPTPVTTSQSDKVTIDNAIEMEVTTPKPMTKTAALTDTTETPAEDLSGAAWLTTEQAIFGVENEKVSPSKVTFAKVVQKLNTQEETANKRIKVVEDNLAELVETVSTMGKNVNQVGLMMDDLTKTIDTLTQEVVALKEETSRAQVAQRQRYSEAQRQAQAAPSKKFDAAQARPKLDIKSLGPPPKTPEGPTENAFNAPMVTVHAIIPGRAWLKAGKEGKILTVVEGDNIEGYGKVLAIDPQGGAVITSSGIRLK